VAGNPVLNITNLAGSAVPGALHAFLAGNSSITLGDISIAPGGVFVLVTNGQINQQAGRTLLSDAIGLGTVGAANSVTARVGVAAGSAAANVVLAITDISGTGLGASDATITSVNGLQLGTLL